MMTPIQDEWRRRVVAEYRSAAHTHTVTGWLIEIGASPDLIEDGLRIVADELAHAELSGQVLASAGGTVQQVVDRATLRMVRSDPLELGVVRAAVEMFCLGETVAVPLFRRMLKSATQPVAVHALRRIVADEARHRRFGWDLLDWCNEGPLRPLVRQVLQTELPRMVERVEQAYGRGTSRDVPELWRTWGLIAPAEYATDLRTTERVWWSRRFARMHTG